VIVRFSLPVNDSRGDITGGILFGEDTKKDFFLHVEIIFENSSTPESFIVVTGGSTDR
jgi:hypothetical protein